MISPEQKTVHPSIHPSSPSLVCHERQQPVLSTNVFDSPPHLFLHNYYLILLVSRLCLEFLPTTTTTSKICIGVSSRSDHFHERILGVSPGRETGDQHAVTKCILANQEPRDQRKRESSCFLSTNTQVLPHNFTSKE